MTTVRAATLTDLGALIALVEVFHLEEGLRFDAQIAANLEKLIADSTLGGVWLAEAEGQVAGYAVMGFGFSLEYGGRDAMIDELFVAESYRGRGMGRVLMEHVVEFCRAQGIKAVHLEVDRKNELGAKLYRGLGFVEGGREFLTKWL